MTDVRSIGEGAIAGIGAALALLGLVSLVLSAVGALASMSDAMAAFGPVVDWMAAAGGLVGAGVGAIAARSGRRNT